MAFPNALKGFYNSYTQLPAVFLAWEVLCSSHVFLSWLIVRQLLQTIDGRFVNGLHRQRALVSGARQRRASAPMVDQAQVVMGQGFLGTKANGPLQFLLGPLPLAQHSVVGAPSGVFGPPMALFRSGGI